MKNFILILTLVLGLNAFAQNKDRGPGGNPPDRAEMAKKLAESLDLDEDTKASFLEISEKYDNKAKELMEEDRKSGFEKMKALEEEKEEELKTLLTKEQFEKYQTALAEMRPPKPPKRN
ncbi:hypothetical protein [Allomuricauda sp. M10]|uniref:hypothetical protein n=1 Tax=Allomuricauda sp. M10 TaxID=2683292 RepID=UPI001D18DB7D|nr:hypothetical protein [Muricauda sp. M10]